MAPYLDHAFITCEIGAPEADSDAVRCTQLWERWSGRNEGISRFGLLYGGAIQPGLRSPLATRSYFPSCLPASLGIDIAQGVTLDEPAIYVMPWLRADRPRPNEPIDHARPVRVVTGASVGMPDLHSLSDAARWVVDAKLLSFFESDSPVLEIQFESQESSLIDCRPDLPLVFRSTA